MSLVKWLEARLTIRTGIIASIIGVAGAGFRLSLILNAVGSEFAMAPIEIRSISKGVTLFSLMLKQVGSALQTSDSVHTASALETTQEIAEECQAVFNEINGMLDRLQIRDGSLGIQQRFKWCFKKQRVQYLLEQLESLKLSLLVMLQTLQLGKLMASTSKHDPPDEVAIKSEQIQQERAETQNAVILRYWQIREVDRAYQSAVQEDIEDQKVELLQGGSTQQLLTNGSTPQLSIEAPPDHELTPGIKKLPLLTLGEIDNDLEVIKQSPRDMVQASNSAISPLLDRWTKWREIREKRDARGSGASAKYSPQVEALYESDEDDRRRSRELYERDDSPRGYFLEYRTDDWRKPNSAGARAEMVSRKKKFRGYQPSVTADSSDAESRKADTPPQKKGPPPTRHVIDSSSDTSDSEPDAYKRRQRRKSSAGSPVVDKRPQFPPEAPLSRSYGPGPPGFGGKFTTSPSVTPGSTPRGSLSHPPSNGPVMPPRPGPAPDQKHRYHPTMSTPLPPLTTANAPNPYASTSPYLPSPTHGPPGLYQSLSASNLPPQPSMTHPGSGPTQSYAASRYLPPNAHQLTQQQRAMHNALVNRPPSQDGSLRSGTRSPSHMSRDRDYDRYAQAQKHYSDEEKDRRDRRDRRKKEDKKKMGEMGKSVTKGMMGAGAIATFMEALEGLGGL